jgi:sec-independent protein translocase protein TatB
MNLLLQLLIAGCICFPHRSSRIIETPMPSSPDFAVLILLVLLLFGPKKLPELARQFGKLMADFRRASNEFRTQMEDELRLSEQADRQKKIAAAEAATPAPILDPAQAIEAESVYANQNQPSLDSASDAASQYPLDSALQTPLESTYESISESASESTPESIPETAPAPLPIATSGELSILPPSTGLPIANSAQLPFSEGLPAESAAQASVPAHEPAAHQAEALHG